DGRVVVSMRDRAAVEVFEPSRGVASALTRLCKVAVAAEPTGLAVTPDGATLLVASRWGHALTALGTRDMDVRFVATLPRDPRAVVTSSDGKKAFVAHAVGSALTIVDLDGERTRTTELRDRQARERHRPGTWETIAADDPRARPLELGDRQERQLVRLTMNGDRRLFHEGAKFVAVRDQRPSQGYAIVRSAAGHVLLPEALVDVGNGVRSRGYGEAQSAFGDVAAIDEGTEKRMARPAFDGRAGDCLLPRSAAIDPSTDELVVACAGLDEIVVYDAKRDAPHDKELRRHPVPAGPTGVAVDDRRRAVVWSEFARALSVVELWRAKGPGTKTLRVDGASGLSASAERGRVLFHESGERVAFDGRACASCHPDGRDDALTWTTPDGPRQTPMLVGRLEGTAPYGWTGASRDLREHLRHTFDRLAGKGLSAREQDDVFAYVAALRTPSDRPPGDAVPNVVASAGAPPRVGPLVARGDALFHDADAGCATCHLGDALTDGVKHDVKSRARGDVQAAFDTPSLRFVGRSAPYYHDGRYATLADLLRGADGAMGHTSQLSPKDQSALVAYLESL
ncbi:MAG TPA: cytochrome C peroxidase, partial [Byssovorax sp.]